MYFISLEYMELEIAICVSLNSHHGVLWAFDLGLNISGSHSQMEDKSNTTTEQLPLTCIILSFQDFGDKIQ